MTTNNDLDALFADAELPFGHPGRRFDDTPEGFDPSPLVDQEPEPDYTSDEDGGWSTTALATVPCATTTARTRPTPTTPRR